MAVIEKIRQRSGLVIVIIGVALASFLVSDAINSNSSLFRGSNNTVGEIAGNSITYQEYGTKVQTLTEDVEKQQQRTLDEMTRGMVRDQVWNEYIQELVIDEQYEKLGLQVTGAEKFDAVTNPVDIAQIRDAEAFRNKETQMFDRNLVINYIKQLDQDETGEAKKQWNNFVETTVKGTLIQKKYNALVRNGIYITALEVEDDHFGQYVQRDAKIVGFNFNTVPDSSVQVTDEDLKKYLNDHPSEFQQEATRKIEYVLFDVYPTAEDTAASRKVAETTTENFRKTKNDTLFVANYSAKGFDTTYKPRGTFPAEADKQIFEGNPGDVFGPFYNDGKFTTYKVLGFNTDTLPYANVSQILVKPTTGFTKEDSLQLVVRANNIANAIRKGADFAQMAKDSSQDYPTAPKGGELGWIKKGAGRLPEAVERAIFDGGKGSIHVVRSGMGVHIVKVNEEKTYRTAAVAEVESDLEISKETYDKAYQTSFNFASESRTAEEFTANAEKAGVIKRISPDLKEGELTLPSIENARDVIRWAWSEDVKVGDVSQVMELDNKYIVSTLVSIKKKGLATVEDVRDRLEVETRKFKKAEMLKEKIKKVYDANKTMDQLAADLGTFVNFSPGNEFRGATVASVGPDVRLTGIIAGTPDNVVSGPYVTTSGVYVIQIIKTNKTPFPTDIAPDRNRMMQSTSSTVVNKAFESLKEAANVKDYRYKFF